MLILPFTTDDITAIVNWAGTLVGDVMPLLVVIIGISIGAWVISIIIGRFRG